MSHWHRKQMVASWTDESIFLLITSLLLYFLIIIHNTQPFLFYITSHPHSILEPNFTFNVALETKLFLMVNLSLLAFNSSCSIALKLQTLGYISKSCSVSSLTACSYGWICTAVTQSLQRLVKCNQGVMLYVCTVRSLEPGIRIQGIRIFWPMRVDGALIHSGHIVVWQASAEKHKTISSWVYLAV